MRRRNNGINGLQDALSPYLVFNIHPPSATYFFLLPFYDTQSLVPKYGRSGAPPHVRVGSTPPGACCIIRPLPNVVPASLRPDPPYLVADAHQSARTKLASKLGRTGGNTSGPRRPVYPRRNYGHERGRYPTPGHRQTTPGKRR